jgi:hypothetical protein
MDLSIGWQLPGLPVGRDWHLGLGLLSAPLRSRNVVCSLGSRLRCRIVAWRL